MALHRRIPKKNRKKLKSVDPFNTKGNSKQVVDGLTKKKRNNAPANLNEEQPLTKAQKMLMKSDEVMDKKAVKNKKKQKNAVLKEAENIGLKKGRFETVERFVRRVQGVMHNRINENMAIAKHGLAGRKQEEIDADYAKIDEAEKRRKDQERREIENKIKEAKKKREKEAARKEEMEKWKKQRKDAKRREMEEEEGEEEEEDEEEHNNDDKDSDDYDDDSDGEESSKKKSDEPSPKKPKLSKKDRRKEMLKTRKVQEQTSRASDAVFNSREVIEFGERYDAPPVFAGHLKKKFEPLMAKAGQKTLLLHSMLQKGNEKTKYLDNSTSKIHEERQNVIDAYRKLKKAQRTGS